MDNEKILLTNVQRFSLHDGPGIRTTVFLKGCPLNCPWCSNPENISFHPQPYVKGDHAGIYGKWHDPEAIVEECLKDRLFYEGEIHDWRITSADQLDSLPGGVTFSGGECLLQMPKLVKVCKLLHEEKVHIACETCLFIQPEYLDLALDNIDLFYVDVKILNPRSCAAVEKGELSLYLRNIEKLFLWKDSEGYHKPVVVRIPVIGSYTDSSENRKRVYALVEEYKNAIIKIELIKEHDLAQSKYNSLGLVSEYIGVEESLLEQYKLELSRIGIPIEICKI